MLHNPCLRRLLGALAVSQLGDWLYNVALIAFVFERTHSATWLGATTAARVLPVVLLGPVAGIVADRVDRRVVMIVSDGLRVATMAGLVAVVHLGLPVLLVPVLAAAATAAASPYPSCVAASVPRLLPPEQLPAANALRSAIGTTAVVAGPAAGAAVLAAGGVVWAFAVNGLTFAVSALLVLAVPDRAAFRPALATEREPGLWAAVSLGARELLHRPAVCRFVGADILCSLCYGVLTVALVGVSVRMGGRAPGYGLLLGAVGAGGVAGAVLTPRLCRRFGRTAVLSLALLVTGAALPLLVVGGSFTAALVVAAAFGAGSTVVEVGSETVLQEQLPDEVFARAYGFAFPASIGAIALGSVLAAPLISALGIAAALALTGAVVAGYAAWLGVSARPASDVRPSRPDCAGVGRATR